MAAFFFKFSSYQFAHMGEKLGNDIDATGQQTGTETIDVAGRHHSMEAQAGATAKSQTLNEVGSELYGAGIGKTAVESYASNAQYAETMSEQGIGTHEGISMSGQMNGATSAGSVMGRKSLADSRSEGIGEVSSDLAQTTQNLTDANTGMSGDLLESLGGKHSVDAANTKVGIDRASETGKLNASTNEVDHVVAATTGVQQNFGEKTAVREKASVTGGSVEGLSHLRSKTGIESELATHDTRQQHVENSGYDDTQQVANEASMASITGALGNHDAMAGKVVDGSAGSMLDVATGSSKNSYTESLAGLDAREDVASNTGQDANELAYRMAVNRMEDGHAQFEKREDVSDAVGLDRQTVADREASHTKLPLSEEEMITAGTFSPDEISAAAANGGAIVSGAMLDGQLVNTHTSAGDSASSNSSVSIKGGLETRNAASIVESGSFEENRALLLATSGNEANIRSLARDLSSNSLLHRTQQESDGSGHRYAWNSGATITASASTDIFGGGTGGSLPTGGLGDTPTKSVNDMLGYNGGKAKESPMGGMGKLAKIAKPVDVGASISTGVGHTASSTDDSNTTTSSDPLVAQFHGDIAEAFTQLNGNREHDQPIVDEWRQGIMEQLNSDQQQAVEKGEEMDMDQLKDETWYEKAADSISDWFNDDSSDEITLVDRQ